MPQPITVELRGKRVEIDDEGGRIDIGDGGADFGGWLIHGFPGGLKEPPYSARVRFVHAHPAGRNLDRQFAANCGSQSAIWGQIDRITSISSMVITNGDAPMMTSSILPRLRNPCTT